MTARETGTGRYDHWGLARVYGEDAAQSAIRASHRVLLSEVLKKPLAVLLKDVPASCAKEHLTESEFLSALAQSSPKPLSPAARAHLGSVLSALSALVENRENANPRSRIATPITCPRTSASCGLSKNSHRNRRQGMRFARRWESRFD